MVNAAAPQELIRRYADSGDPVLALELQRSIRAMTSPQKLKLARGLNNQEALEVQTPAVETFQDGEKVAEAQKIAEVPVTPVEIVPTAPIEVAEPVVPPEVEATDRKIVEIVDQADPAIKQTDQAQEIAEAGESPAENPDVVSAAMPISKEQAREKLLVGDPNVSTDEAEIAEAVWSSPAE